MKKETDSIHLAVENHKRRRLFKLVVRASDLGTPSLYNDVEIRIFVLDINDHGPRFEKDIYSVQIPENIKGGTPIIQVSFLYGK